MTETLHAKIQNSPFRNIYWFSRYLLNTDKFGALGKQKEIQLLETVSVLEVLLAQENFSAAEKITLFKNTLANEIKKMTKAGTKTYSLSLNLLMQLDEDIKTVEDAFIFCVAMKYFVAPINHAIALVPTDDKKFSETAAKNFLDTFGAEKVDLLISTWDNLGIKGCLDIERSLVQEFERRLGQKRKSRGGQRDVASYWYTTYAVTSFSYSLPQTRQLFVDFSKVARTLALDNF